MRLAVRDDDVGHSGMATRSGLMRYRKGVERVGSRWGRASDPTACGPSESVFTAQARELLADWRARRLRRALSQSRPLP